MVGKYTKVAGLILALGSLSACYVDSGKSVEGNTRDAKPSVKVTFQAEASEEDQLALSHTQAAPETNSLIMTAFKMLVGCDGVPEVVVERAPFDLPFGATNCIAKIKSVRIGGRNYVEPAGGAGFKDYLVRDQGILINGSDPGDKLYLIIQAQLPSPLNTQDAAVAYEYSNLFAFDAVTIARAQVPHNGSVFGNDAPRIKAVAATLRPNVLNLKFTCEHNDGFVKTAKAITCGAQNVQNFNAGLIAREDLALPLNISALAEFARGKLVPISTIPHTIGKERRLVVGFKDVKPTKNYLIVLEHKGSYTYGPVRLVD